MNNQINYIIQRSLNEEQIKDILTTAIEGGIGYWACLHNDHPDWVTARKMLKEKNGEAPCYCDVAYELLFNNKAIVFSDAEDDDEVWELTLEKFLNGCRLYEEERGKSLSKIIDECEFDAEDADCVIQYALFSELIFG